MECPDCGYFDESVAASYYARKCRVCGGLIPPAYKPKVVQENELKLMLLQAKVREMIRKKITQKTEK